MDKSGKSRKNRERPKKDKKGRTSPDREAPPFETPPPRLAALELLHIQAKNIIIRVLLRCLESLSLAETLCKACRSAAVKFSPETVWGSRHGKCGEISGKFLLFLFPREKKLESAHQSFARQLSLRFSPDALQLQMPNSLVFFHSAAICSGESRLRGSQRFESPPVRSDSKAHDSNRKAKCRSNRCGAFTFFTYKIGFKLPTSIR